MNEMKEKLQEEYENCDTRRTMWEELFATSGWRDLQTICRSQLATRKQSMAMSMPKTQDEAMALAGASWECAGISLVMSIPETEYNELKDRMETIQLTIQEEKEHER